jgi:rare lipoprotein A
MKNLLKNILMAVSATLSLSGKEPVALTGDASFYAREYVGKRMANGQPYNAYLLTMATYAFPLGSIVELTYISKGGTKRSVVCEVTDRGPSKALRDKGRLFDLSHTAFRILENPKVGVIHVTAVRIK